MILHRSAAKAKSTANQLVEELSATMIWDEPSLAVVRHTWNEHVWILLMNVVFELLLIIVNHILFSNRGKFCAVQISYRY